MCITCGLAAAFLAACGGLIGDSPKIYGLIIWLIYYVGRKIYGRFINKQ